MSQHHPIRFVNLNLGRHAIFGDIVRVLMLTPGYIPIKGGTETMVRNVSILLNKRGIHTDIMTFNMVRKWNPIWREKVEDIDGIRVYKIPALNWLPMNHSNRITLGINLIPGRFTHHLKDYDILHFHEGELSFPLFSSLVKKPKILHFHGLDIDIQRRYFLSTFILKHVADLHISLTELMRKYLIELGFDKNKICMVPNGVDAKFFCPSGERRKNLVVFVGRIIPSKGLHVLLRSLRWLKPSINLVIIGPQGWNQEYSEYVRNLIESENNRGKHKIKYVGAQDPAGTRTWYQKASVVVLPTLGQEAFGLVLAEALSCETPVVATAVGGIPEVVMDGKNGILIPPNDEVNLARAIEYFVNNEEARTRFGKNGREWVLKRFSLDTVVDKLVQIYSQLLGSR